LQGMQPGRGWGSKWHGTDIPWHGPRSALHPSLPSLGPRGYGGLLASTAQPAMGTGPTSLPATGKGPGLPVPTATAGTPGVTSPGPGGALDLTTGVLEPPGTEGPPERGHGLLDQTLVALGSTVAGQSSVPYTSPGSPLVPRSRQPDPIGDSALTSLTPQHLPGTSQGVPVLSPTVGTLLAGTFKGTLVGVGNSKPWAATAPLSAPGSPQLLAWSQPASSLRLTTTMDVTATTVTTTTTTAATTSPALLEDMGTVTPKPGAAVLQGDVAEFLWGLPTPLPTMMPGLPQQPTENPGALGHHGGSGSPPAAGDTDLVQPSDSPRAWLDGDTPRAMPAPAGAGRAPRVFIVEDQPPLLKVSLLRIPCELVLDMGFIPALKDPRSPEHQGLLHSFNQTVAPLFMSVPGFLWLEVTGIRWGSVVLEYDALFAAERVQTPGLGALLDAALGSGVARPGLAVGTAPVLRNVVLARPLDPCTELFACRVGFTCMAGVDGNATCTSLCHRDYCKNHGICTHLPDHQPLCQCPVGSDFWFMGLRCDYRVTQQSLLGMAVGVLLSIVLLGAVLAAVAIRRFKVLLLEARADQTRSSYRRFCRLDDVSAQYWSRSWLPSASSLDNPAFSNSEELLHLQILDNSCCSCQEGLGTTGSAKQHPALPAPQHSFLPSFHYDWDTSSSSMNDPMVDSGKASDISVSSWPMEPIPWTPFPLVHQLSRQRPHKGRRPHSYCEGMELATLERSWTA
ncbi:IMPG2 protein, partial [Hemiprocne comata]|nr:IMPG2 protein [Hemiprocne comata]